MPIYEINPLQDPRWNALAESHPYASVFHNPSWLQSLQDTYAYEPVAISTCAPSVPLTNALLFCRVKSWLTGSRYVSLPFSDHCNPLVDGALPMNDLLLHMRDTVDGTGWKYVEIRPTELAPTNETCYGRSNSYYLHRLDLRTTQQNLFRSFHKDCVQRKIKRAEKESLFYEEGNSDVLLKKFYRLLVQSRRRQNLPPQPLSWFRNLISAFGKSLKIRLASKDGEPVASILTLPHNKVMTYKYGCAAPQFNRLGGMALLFWRTIEEAIEKGFEELDMGRSDTDNAGLVAFKEHWGAERYSLNYWRYPFESAPVESGVKMRVLRKMFSVSPDWPLIAAGRVLYRHIG
jgi:CelD/BcsL family acetyltransferase involved in cellulose biosynthesis